MVTEILRVRPAQVSSLAREVKVRMRDGVRLAADVYLPGGDESPGDTILIRLPYDKSGPYTFIPLIAEHFMAHGYRVIAQDVRGKFRSEGETLLFVNEARDGYDTIDWIVQQQWSNGRVAMWGDSYYGYTQWAAVSTQHPALKAIAPRVTGTQLGEPVRRVDGDVVSRVEWGITYLYALTYFHSQDAYFWRLDPDRRPFSAQVEEALEAIGSRSISYDQWFPRPVHLRRFPDGSPFDARPIPVLQTIGMWDNCAPLSWADVAELDARPTWAMNHFLRLEPMDHESYYVGDTPEQRVEERTDAQIRAELPRMLDPTLEFFEVFVRGNGSATDIPKVAWALAGTEGMRASPTWPPAGARPWRLVGDSEGRLTADAPAARTLGWTADAPAARTLGWTHDPTDLVPSSAENAFAFLLERPDEAPLGDRDDVLVFTGDAVEYDVDLVGPARARGRIHSDGPVMDLFVRVLDVAPDGTALRIARGQVQLADASVPTAVDIDLGQLAYRLAAGHRLRVHVSSSDYPEFIPQPGTGEDPWSAVATRANHQTLEVGGDEPFTVVLSVLDETQDGAA
jgi:putative CocE/NonD family hydrolase